MIYSRTIVIAAGSVAEIFDEMGISPGRHGITIQTAANVCLVEDSTGANPGPRVNSNSGIQGFQSYTNKDPVYLKNLSSVDQAIVYVALTEMP